MRIYPVVRKYIASGKIKKIDEVLKEKILTERNMGVPATVIAEKYGVGVGRVRRLVSAARDVSDETGDC